MEETTIRVKNDVEKRREYLDTAFTHLIIDLQTKVQELQNKIAYSDPVTNDKINKQQQRIDELIEKKNKRLKDLTDMEQLSEREPEIMGCALVLPLTQVEYKGHYGMSRDDEAEGIAMEVAMEFERNDGWIPVDVSKNNEGFDIRSTNPDKIKRYIEVKGRSSSDGDVMLSENEWNRLSQLGDSCWLYIVIKCKSNPE